MSQIQATPIPRNNTPRLLRYRPLLLLLLIAFPGCKIFEYPPEQITLDDNAIHVANIGFKGYRLHLPPGFRRLSDHEVDELSADHWIIRLRRGYRNSEGIDYHFFSDHVFQKDKQLIYFVPFLNKRVQKFIYVPEDILERYLINWVRHAEFTKRIQLDLDWNATSDRQRRRSTVTLTSKKPYANLVYEQRIITGDLNEMFLLAGFAPPEDAHTLNQTLNQLEQAIEVIR